MILFLNPVQLRSQGFNTISRLHTPVIIKGESLPLFLSIPIDSICIARYLSRSGQWEAIPFQIDERDGGKSFFGDKNGLLDPDDEIVFLSKDVGDSPSTTEWIDDKDAQDHPRYKISISDPLFPSQQGWVIIYQSATYPKSSYRYIQVDEVEDRVESDTYKIIHGSSGLQHDLFLKSSAGGDEIDLLDRQKLRVKARVNYKNIVKTITLTEEYSDDWTVFPFTKLYIKVKKKSVEYSANNVIRVHRNLKLEASAKISGGILDKKGEFPFISTFYPTFSEWAPESLDPSLFGNYGEIKMMRVTSDLNEKSVGMLFYNSYNPDGIRIDGISTAYNDSIDWPGNNTHLMVADPSYTGTLINQTSIVTLTAFEGNPISTSQIFYFNDNSSKNSSDTGDKYAYGESGVEILSNNITSVLDYYTASYYIPKNINFSQANTLIQKHLNPLEIQYHDEYIAYDLVVQTDPPDAGWIDINGSTSKDSTVILTAYSYSDFEFDYWSGDLTGTENPATLFMDRPKTVTAHFRSYRNITVTSSRPGLVFYADHDTFSTPYTFSWLEGDMHSLCIDSILVDFEDVRRYRFVSWDHSVSRCHDYLVPEYDQTLAASFSKQFHITTLANPIDGGTIHQFPAEEWFDQYGSVTLEAIPAEYLTFQSWFGSITTTENPVTILMDTAKVIMARFGNLSPVVNFPDTSFNEDDSLVISYQQIYDWITDNSNDTTLSIDFDDGQFLKIEKNNLKKEIKIFSQQTHWNGTDTLFAIITDPIGALATDTFLVTVVPLPDPPGLFSLLYPDDGTLITEWSDEIDFLWEISNDPDQEDTVLYVFEIDTSATVTSSPFIRVGKLKEPMVSLSLPILDWGNIYYWRVQAIDQTGRSTWSNSAFTLDLTTLIDPENTSAIPITYILSQNYPNPFNGITQIRFGLPVTTQVSLLVYNNYGQEVTSLCSGYKNAGYHTVQWDGTNQKGLRVSTGVYFIVLQTKLMKIVKKAILIQ